MVPTMGALHEGHAALVRQAARLRADRSLPCVVVSVFVNPTQFDDPSDYQRYPRTLEADITLCAAAGATAVLAPEVGAVYPSPESRVPPPESTLPRVATAPGLEDARRPGHFAGVVMVVARLFELAAPSAAIFGEKDWQQLRVIAEMVQARSLQVEVVAAPTHREADGLAMSSRNRFLSREERSRASAMRAALLDAAGCPDADGAEAAMRATLTNAGIVPDYAVVRHAHTLERAGNATVGADGAVLPPGPWRAIIAGRLGSVRLLDNAAWPSPFERVTRMAGSDAV